jgi:DNA-binding NarL/FixJ family response regulator
MVGSAVIRILIVEDSPTVALLIESALKGQGYEIAGRADSGSGAVELALETKPDLVLMDISLVGDMDGIEAARAIREGPGSPVVFRTSQMDAEVLARAKMVEPHGYLLKPVDPRAFRPTIEMALHKHAMERERQELTERLQAALAEVEQLQGLLPVCAWCRRVRDDKGYWENLEGYLARHLNTKYSHGICQDCLARV